MGALTSLSKAATSSLLEASEAALFLFAMLVVIGLIGEHKFNWWQPKYKLYEMLVVVGCAGELLADGGVFLFSSHLETLSNMEIAELSRQAKQFELQATQLRTAIADREISSDQQSAIRSALVGFAGRQVVIRSYPNDQEAARLILQLRSALEPNIHVEDRTGELAARWDSAALVLGIEINSEQNGRDFAAALVNAFRNAGGLSVQDRSALVSPRVATEILVGMKPVALAQQTARIAERTETRGLDADQRKRVADRLRAFSGQKFNLFGYAPDQETVGIANNLLTALVNEGSAGWTSSVSTGNIASGWVVGMQVLVKPDADPSSKAAARELALALRSERLSVEGPRESADHTPAIEKGSTLQGKFDSDNPITVVIGKRR